MHGQGTASQPGLILEICERILHFFVFALFNLARMQPIRATDWIRPGESTVRLGN